MLVRSIHTFQLRSALETVVALYLTSLHIYFLLVKALHEKQERKEHL